MERNKIFFFHIPKCAGTSIWRHLAKIYGDKNIFQIASADDVKTFGEIPLADLQAYDAIGGHHFLSTYRERLGDFEGYFKITVIRDPIDRLISSYNFIRRDRRHPRYKQVRQSTFEEFAMSEAPNAQTQLLTGGVEYQDAIRILDDWFDDYTTSDRADQLMQKISEVGHTPFKRAMYKNVSRRKVKREAVEPSLLDRLKQIHDADLRLFDHVLERRVNQA